MATAVLHPQDLLRDPFTNRHGGLHSTPPRTNIRRNHTPTPTPSSSATKHSRGQSNNRRKRSPNSSPPPRRTPDPSLSPQSSSAASKLLAIGQVKILKRGDEIQTINNNNDPPAAAGVKANDRKVEMKLDLAVSPPATPKRPPVPAGSPLLNRSVDGFYAGSGFFTSPPPSSLPVPVFLKKSVGVVVNIEATNDLRRLLNLAL